MWQQGFKMWRQEAFPDIICIGEAQYKATVYLISLNCGEMKNLVGQRWSRHSPGRKLGLVT